MEQQQFEAGKALEEAHLKKTPVRMALLKYFMSVEYAQSYFDLENTFNKKFDKSTVYRTLGSFEERGLLHRIDDASGITKYAYGTLDNGHYHYHFLCNQCKNTYCMENDNEELVSLPEGFRAKRVNTVVNGICANC